MLHVLSWLRRIDMYTYLWFSPVNMHSRPPYAFHNILIIGRDDDFCFFFDNCWTRSHRCTCVFIVNDSFRPPALRLHDHAISPSLHRLIFFCLSRLSRKRRLPASRGIICWKICCVFRVAVYSVSRWMTVRLTECNSRSVPLLLRRCCCEHFHI